MTIPRSRDLRLLAGAAGLSALGDFLALIPLVLHVQQRTGSTFAVSAVFFALWGPVVLGAGLAGAIVDRFENRALLVGVAFAQAAVVAAIAVCVNTPWAVLPLVALLGFGVAVSQPAEFALVPAAAGEADVARANGLMETVRSLGFTAGPLLGGVLGAAGLLQLALALNALSFVVVALAGLALRARRSPAGAQAADQPIRARDGLAFLVHDRALAVTLGGAVAALGVFTMSATAEPFFVIDVLGAGSFG
jgi:MFS family permease